MQKVIYFLINNLKYIIIFYILIQLVYIIFFPAPYKSDSLYYYQLSLSSLNHGTVYPSYYNINENYIIAPLFINLESLILSIYNSVFSIRILHLVLNLLQLYILYYITKKHYGKKVSKVFVLLYIFYLPNIGFVQLNMTELFFGVLLSLCIYSLFKETKTGYLFSGIFAAASLSARPTGWALLASLLIYIISIKSEIKFQIISWIFTGAILFFIVFGITTQLSSDHFVVTSVNYGTNFLIGANDDATGAYNDRVFQQDKAGFINAPESKTYIYKQHLWFFHAVNWVKENPVKWVKLIPLKFIHIFVWDDYAVSPLLGMQDWNLYVLMKHLLIIKDSEKLMSNVPFFVKIAYIFLQIFHHIYYFTIMIVFLLVVIKNFKTLIKNNLFKLFLLIILISLVIPLFSFGDARFKYPYILMIMILISPFVNNYFNKIKLIS